MKFTLKKILFLYAVLNLAIPVAAVANTYDEMSQSIERAWNKYFSAEAILLTLVLLALLIGVMVFFETRRSRKIERGLRALALAKFDLQAEKLDLRMSSATILKRIVQKTGLQDPASIMKFSSIFEDSVNKYYEIEKIESIPNETLAQISALRKTLGFSPLPGGIVLTSTRQFCSGDKCTIQIPENDPPPTLHGTCYVIELNERQWSITRPEGPKVQVGTWARISLAKPNDGEYIFRAQVLSDFEEEIVFSHTNMLNRVQQRNWARVDVAIPVIATLMDERRVGEVLQGKIVDISGGGLRMILPDKLAKDSMLILNFELPGQGQISDLLVRVVRFAVPTGVNTSKIVHDVSVALAMDSDCEKIIKFVFEKQRGTLSIRQA